MMNEVNTILQENEITLFIPENPLSGNAISLGKEETKSFSDWTKKDDIDCYYLLHKMILVWRKHYNRDHYLVYGNLKDNAFSFEGVPFKKKASVITTQLKTLYRVLTKGHKMTDDMKAALAQDYAEKFESTPLRIERKINQFVKTADPFCKTETLDAQTIFEGKKVRVLVDHNPLPGGKNPLHFLIVPIEHKSTFQDLSESEYTEAMHYARLLYRHFDMQPHLLHKNGKTAGQSIDHWHLHVIFTASKSDAFTGKMKMLKNMLIGAAPLSEEELETKLQDAKAELLPVFKEHPYT